MFEPQLKYKKKLAWQEPMEIAAKLDELQLDFVLLLSSLKTDYSGTYSVIALDKTKDATSILSLRNLINEEPQNPVFGYLGYELGHNFEHEGMSRKRLFINTPELVFSSFDTIIIFQHIKKEITIYSEQKIEHTIPHCTSSELSNKFDHPLRAECKLKSYPGTLEYIDTVNKTIKSLYRGDFYQANISRKFYGKISVDDDVGKFGIFFRLCKASPSPYSSFMKFGNLCIISSSPELFLKINDNLVLSTPIKGTIKRNSDPYVDEQLRRSMMHNAKEKAEHLMIVDLMRNDLTKYSEPGSIKVQNLFKIYSYSTIHHMVSSVISKKLNEIDALEFVRNCFPPGSVTGAPKIQAINWCNNVERMCRGVYCGAIGYITQKSTELSVAIRTLIIEDEKMEFQVGGAITIDSNAYAELAETTTKGLGIAKALGVEKLLANLSEMPKDIL